MANQYERMFKQVHSSACKQTRLLCSATGCCIVAALLLLLQSFEQLNPRAVAVVVDPIQSVKGKVVIDAFR